MAGFTERNLKQQAVYWGSPVADGYGGYTWADPVEIDVRWEKSTRVFRDASGQETVSRAIVFAKQDLDENGMLYLGDLDDLDSSEEADPRTVSGAYQIRRFDKSPGIKGTGFLRMAYL